METKTLPASQAYPRSGIKQVVEFGVKLRCMPSTPRVLAAVLYCLIFCPTREENPQQTTKPKFSYISFKSNITILDSHNVYFIVA